MKILILHASFGSGHKRAAQAISEALIEKGIDAQVHDLLEFLPQPLASFYSFGYVFLIHKARWLWKLLYESMDRSSAPYAPACSPSQRWQFNRLRNFLCSEKFDIIVCTHFTPAALLADWKQQGILQTKTFSVITDHVAHRCWKRAGLDHYFAPSEDVVNQLESAGIPRDKISVSGIPVAASFCKLLSSDNARSQWNCPEGSTVVLMFCSALTYSRTIKLLNEIASLDQSIYFLVSTGPDNSKQEKIKKKFQEKKNFFFFGFSPRVADLMAAADLIITKPGGLIVSEALAAGKPQILYAPIPGQEEANAAFAESHHAALCIQRLKNGSLKRAIQHALADPGRLSDMSLNARKIGKPFAAQTIADWIQNGN